MHTLIAIPTSLPDPARSAGRLRAAIGWLVLLSVPASALAQAPAPSAPQAACSCAQPGTGMQGTLLWRGDQVPGLQKIATLAAPILWFSPDEPLLISGEGPLPNSLPCDSPAPTGAVYYKAQAFVLRGGERVTVPAEDDAKFFEKVEALTIRYYLYYRKDVGVGSHTHDMEVVDLDVRLGNTGACYEIRIATAIGFAHGVAWYQNELRLGPDTRLPLTVLVEEGKHASSPDRNADGVYTPGYDVNRRANDAWGIRDVMGSGYLLSSGYSATMAKTRRPETRAFPPASPDACPVPSAAPHSPDRGLLNRYELRRADTFASCPADAGERLARMIKTNKFGSAYPPAQHQSLLARSAAERLTGTNRFLPSVAYRYEDGNGFSLILAGIGIGNGYLVPKFNVTGDRGLAIQGLATTSAARFFSPYLAAGVARQRLQVLDPTQPDLVTEEDKWNFASEAGIKFRFGLSGKGRILGFGYQFAGVRVGYSLFGVNNPRTRLIFEVGAGVW
jgi:hypothetical protein